MKKILFYLLWCVPFFASAQVQGKIHYKETMSFKFESDDPETQQRMAQMPTSFDNYHILYFNANTSFYGDDQEEIRKADALAANQNAGMGDEGGMRRFGGGGMRRMMGSNEIFKDLEKQLVLNKTTFMGRNFLINDDFKNFAWQVSEDTQTILGYQCIKATYVDTSSVAGPMSMPRNGVIRMGGGDGRRNDQAAPPKQDPVEVVAWFAPGIPAPVGPNDTGMLPGAILRLDVGRTSIIATKVDLEADPADMLKVPTEGQKMSRAEYTKMLTQKMQEFREMQQQNRGGGGVRVTGGRMGGH
jgi:GLPGLI family protein